LDADAHQGEPSRISKTRNPSTIIVPVHGNKDLKPGTQRAIMKDAEISEGDL
jgi:predicted RNA binding protein YcfA (HicA-like mRNA interferase family)